MMEQRVAQPSGLVLDYTPAKKACGRPPLFLLHGWGHTSRCWQPLMPFLVEQQDVYCLDLPGFGNNAYCQLPELNDVVEQVGQLLPDPCVLLGWSLGGNLALRLAGHFPQKVAAVITLATNVNFIANPHCRHAMPRETFAAFRQQFAEAPAATLKRFCGLQAQGDVKHKSLLKNLREQCSPPTDNQLTQWQAALGWLAQINHENELDCLPIPLLHLFGEKDALVPMAAAQTMRQISPGQVATIAGAGHAMHITCTDGVMQHIDHFLSNADSVVMPRMTNKSAQLDKQRVALSFNRAATTYDTAAHVQTRVGRHLLQYSPSVSPGEEVLDLGCGTGFCADFFQRKNAQVTALDIAPAMLRQAREKFSPDIHWVCADAEYLPFAEEKFAGVVSNLTVQWSENLPPLFNGLRNSLQAGGWLLLSTLGPATLQELRASWRVVDNYTHVNDFASAEVLQAALHDSGMAVELFVEDIVVPRYTRLNTLMRELKALGAHNVNASRNRGLTGPRYLRALNQAYEQFRGPDGKLPATYQVFYVLARKKQQ